MASRKLQKQYEKMELSVSGYKAVFIAVMAGAGDEEFEEVEKRFRKDDSI